MLIRFAHTSQSTLRLSIARLGSRTRTRPRHLLLSIFLRSNIQTIEQMRP